MNHVPRVGEAERAAHLLHPAQLLDEGHRRGLPDHVRHRLALDVLHDDVRHAVGVAEVVDGDDVGVRERAGRASLLREALAELVRRNVGLQQFDRDESVDRRVAGQEDGPHAALPEPLSEFIPADELLNASHLFGQGQLYSISAASERQEPHGMATGCRG